MSLLICRDDVEALCFWLLVLERGQSTTLVLLYPQVRAVHSYLYISIDSGVLYKHSCVYPWLMGTSPDIDDMLLDRLNAECAVSGGLYVALLTLWTLCVADKADSVDDTIMVTVAEAVNQYEKMHIP